MFGHARQWVALLAVTVVCLAIAGCVGSEATSETDIPFRAIEAGRFGFDDASAGLALVVATDEAASRSLGVLAEQSANLPATMGEHTVVVVRQAQGRTAGRARPEIEWIRLRGEDVVVRVSWHPGPSDSDEGTPWVAAQVSRAALPDPESHTFVLEDKTGPILRVGMVGGRWVPLSLETRQGQLRTLSAGSEWRATDPGTSNHLLVARNAPELEAIRVLLPADAATALEGIDFGRESVVAYFQSANGVSVGNLPFVYGVTLDGPSLTVRAWVSDSTALTGLDIPRDAAAPAFHVVAVPRLEFAAGETYARVLAANADRNLVEVTLTR